MTIEMKRFHYDSEGEAAPVRIEQVFAEKPGGGLVADPGFDAPETTAVGKNSDGKFAVIKSYRLVSDVNVSDTTVSIAKGSGIAVGDALAYGKKAVACTAVDTTGDDKDVVTVTMGVDIAAGESLYQAKAASADAAAPILTPEYILGNAVFGGRGDQPVRLVNGANVRKETACIGSDIEALLVTIKRV
jgi:hypothetical protein